MKPQFYNFLLLSFLLAAFLPLRAQQPATYTFKGKQYMVYPHRIETRVYGGYAYYAPHLNLTTASVKKLQKRRAIIDTLDDQRTYQRFSVTAGYTSFSINNNFPDPVAILPGAMPDGDYLAFYSYTKPNKMTRKARRQLAKDSIHVAVTFSLKSGRLHGLAEYYTYWENKTDSGYFENGQREGSWCRFSRDIVVPAEKKGHYRLEQFLFQKAHFHRDLMHGPNEIYTWDYETGKPALISKGNMYYGQPQGRQETYYPTGSLMGVYNYAPVPPGLERNHVDFLGSRMYANDEAVTDSAAIAIGLYETYLHGPLFTYHPDGSQDHFMLYEYGIPRISDTIFYANGKMKQLRESSNELKPGGIKLSVWDEQGRLRYEVWFDKSGENRFQYISYNRRGDRVAYKMYVDLKSRPATELVLMDQKADGENDAYRIQEYVLAGGKPTFHKVYYKDVAVVDFEILRIDSLKDYLECRYIIRDTANTVEYSVLRYSGWMSRPDLKSSDKSQAPKPSYYGRNAIYEVKVNGKPYTGKTEMHFYRYGAFKGLRKRKSGKDLLSLDVYDKQGYLFPYTDPAYEAAEFKFGMKHGIARERGYTGAVKRMQHPVFMSIGHASKKPTRNTVRYANGRQDGAAEYKTYRRKYGFYRLYTIYHKNYKEGSNHGVFTEYQRNKKGKMVLSRRYQYADGYEHGDNISYNLDIPQALDYHYKSENGLRHGEQLKWGPKGNLTDKFYFYYGLKDGVWTDYNRDSSIESETSYYRGYYKGTSREYNKRGMLKIEVQVAMEDSVSARSYTGIEQLTGNYRLFYNHGVLAGEGRKDQGSPVGWWKYYDEAGALSKKVYYRDSSLAVGRGDTIDTRGLLETYFPGGKPEARGWITNQEFHYDCTQGRQVGEEELYWLQLLSANGDTLVKNGNGTVKLYHPNGKLKAEGPVQNGKMQGLWKGYAPDGGLNSIGTYREGEKDGRWLSGDLSGIVFVDGACFADENMRGSYEKDENTIYYEESWYYKGRLVRSNSSSLQK